MRVNNEPQWSFHAKLYLFRFIKKQLDTSVSVWKGNPLFINSQLCCILAGLIGHPRFIKLCLVCSTDDLLGVQWSGLFGQWFYL